MRKIAGLLAALTTMAGADAFAVESVEYFDPVGGTNATCSVCIAYTNQATLTTGWYVVKGEITKYERIVIDGDVNLILCDNSELSADQGGSSAGVNVSTNNSLTIWAQSTNSVAGKLVAAGAAYSSGIGGGEEESAGAITINGGFVKAVGGWWNSWSLLHINGTNVRVGQCAAGIGGGNNGSGGKVTINGGKVTTIGGTSGAGIGGGPGGSGGTLTVNGGEVTAIGYQGGAGIGGGNSGSGGEVTINGGTVVATCKAAGAGIGGGTGGSGGKVVINSGTVTAVSDNGGGIGGGPFGAGGEVSINGGVVTAISEHGIAIGGDLDPSSNGGLFIYERAKVTAGERDATAMPVAATGRVDACRNNGYARIEPCRSPHCYKGPSCAWCGTLVAVSNVVARQRWPWNGLVDIDYDVYGETEGLNAEISFVEQGEAGRCWDANAFLDGAAPSAEPGSHHATWNTTDDSATNIVAKVVATVKLVQAPVAYPLWVGGVQVWNTNAVDVLGDGGKVTYVGDSNSGTLTLSDARIANGYDYGVGFTAGIYEGGGLDLRILLDGSNRIENAQKKASASLREIC